MPITILCATSPIEAKVSIPGSKSITNRALLLASLAEGESFLENVLLSDDTFTLMTALRKLGVLIELDEVNNTFTVKGCSGHFPRSQARIDCHNAGTVARFLLAVCANQIGQFEFDGSARLRERPLSDLITVLRMQGAEISSDFLPLTLSNQHRLKGGDIFIQSDISSQFLSSLLMISPYCQEEVVLTTENLVSEPYIHMTCSMMRDFGVDVFYHEKSWKINVEQKYQARTYRIESDFSSASYFAAIAAVTGGKITLLNMKRENSLQGDSAFLEILEKMGCVVQTDIQNIIIVGPAKLKGVTVDMQHISDTMMTLAAIAPFADSPTRILNIGNTRVKESDRISAMANNLRKLNIHVDEEATALTIYPGVPSSGVIEAYQDHRIAMACSLIGLKVPGIVIDDTQCVNKTFPEFFEIMQKIVN